MTDSLSPSRPVVLIVEDEPLLRLNAVDIVEDAGFHAVEAANADQAIEILTMRSDIRVVFTDVNMPGSMDGLKLAVSVRDRWPPIDIIVTSGAVSPSKEALPIRGRFFPKPYDEQTLIRALRSFVQ